MVLNAARAGRRLTVAASRSSGGHTQPRDSSIDRHRVTPLMPVRVLVVDDEPDSRDLTGAVLTAQGMLVQMAESAAEALAILATSTPDVILSDIGMPAEDGYSLMRRVRAHESSAKRNIPAIALTAFARDKDKQLAIAAGFNLHLAKPVDIEALVQSVNTLAKRTS
jgi:CheY-like chemotaxis protein